MGDEPGTTVRAISRRTFLAACVPVASACARKDDAAPPPAAVAMPLARLPEGVRVTVAVAGRPVEVLRTAAGVTARSLLCTHQGCEVAWDEGARVYACPCHEGRFDSEGRPQQGPPPRPLAKVAARVDGDLVLVGP